jgi:prephenate dehydrogenase
MKVFVIGIGLIEVRWYWTKNVSASDNLWNHTNEIHLHEAITLGVIDAAGSMIDLHTADFVIVSVPVDGALVFCPSTDLIGEETIVFEVGSTKAPICKVVAMHPKRRNFIATHPIAGTEFSGPSAAIVGLFEGKTNILR